jgi:PAS domain S-box-containing protein
MGALIMPDRAAQRLQRAQRMARNAWAFAALSCVCLAAVAILTEPAAINETALVLITLMQGLTLLTTRVYVRQLLRLQRQAAVIEKQNHELRETSARLQREVIERTQVESQRDSFFDLSDDLLVILDQEGRFLRANPAFASRLGEVEAKLRGVELVSFIEPEDSEDFRRALQRVDDASGSHTLEARLQTHEGPRWFIWTLLARGAQLYVVAHDFTQHRQAADALQQAKEAAELESENKTEFLANMSHELRTPLNAIIGFSQTLDMGLYGQLSDKQREYVRDIQGAGEHLLGIVTDLLDLSVIDSGAMVVKTQPVVVAAVIDAALALVRPRAEEAGVHLLCDMPEQLPQIRADVGKIRQILVNLLGNAIKFTPEGGRVTLRAGRDELNGGFFFEVADTGIGIKPTDLPQVLSPFGRLKSAYARAHGGVGLGLPLSLRLARMHEGDISLTSQPGVGTTVRLWLPPERVIEDVKDVTHAHSHHQS